MKRTLPKRQEGSMNNPAPAIDDYYYTHKWDDDGCCIYCDFDGAEWHWWKHSTYEGRAQPEVRMPLCRPRRAP